MLCLNMFRLVGMCTIRATFLDADRKDAVVQIWNTCLVRSIKRACGVYGTMAQTPCSA
jgi:hypothetical protein